MKPSEAKAACESKGPNYVYDLDTGGCVKQIGQAADEANEDYKPKKKKKKQKGHLFSCSAEIDHPKLGRSATLRNTSAANEAEARRNFSQSLKDDNSILKGPVTCTQH
jgi:hypothetical protein